MKNKYQKLLCLTLLIIFFSCSEPKSEFSAIEIAQDSLIIDTHIDVPFRLWMQHQSGKQIDDISNLTSGDFDYYRSLRGGLNIPFFSIYLPANAEQDRTSYVMANDLIDMVEDIVSLNPQKFYLVRSVSEALSMPIEGVIGIALGMENGAPLEGDLTRVKYFFDRGIRYITLTHSKSNHISDSSYDPNTQWDGLSEFGKRLIVEMNKVGVMIDVSHVNDEAFYQAVQLSEVPLIASHSSLRYFTPGFQRNVSDDMLIKLAEKGGVIQINFGSDFISQISRDFRIKQEEYILSKLQEKNIDKDDPQDYALRADILRKEYALLNNYPYSEISSVIDHIDRVVNLVGIDHVGLGSDFDGVGDTLPVGLKDVSMYPNLIERLIERGYSPLDIKKILGGNTLRVWREVELYADGQ